MKLNKKGFAISTMLYGVIFVAIAVFYTIIAIVSNRNTSNTNFVADARQSIEDLRFHGAILECSNRVYNGSSQSVARIVKANYTTPYEYTNAGNYQVSATSQAGYKFADNSTTKTITCPINQASPVLIMEQYGTTSALKGETARVRIMLRVGVNSTIKMTTSTSTSNINANTNVTLSVSYTCPSTLTATTTNNANVSYVITPINNQNYKQETRTINVSYTCRVS